MIRIYDSKWKATLKAAVVMSASLLFAAVTGSAQGVNLTAGPATAAMPDGTIVPMWGYSCGAAGTGGATCAPLSGSSSAAATGSLGGIYVINGGSGYTSAPTVTITPATGNTPTTAAVATAIMSNGQVVGFNVTNHGTGYTAAPTISFSGGGGSGAAAAAAPAWSPVVITVPIATGKTSASLTIGLTNNLSFGASQIPTSIVITGQVGGGLGGTPTTSASPDHSNAQGCPTWFIAQNVPGLPCTAGNNAGLATPPVQAARVRSMGAEVAAVGTPTTLTWSFLKPGTYLLESGTHPSIQVPMGLIGMVVVTQAPAGTAAGVAYPQISTTTAASQVAVPKVQYNAEVPLEFSEIDPVQNKAVDVAVRTPGFSETTVWSGLIGTVVDSLAVTNAGAGYTATPTVAISGGGGSGAMASATIDTTPGSPTQGQVTGITVTNPGMGYTSTPTVLITGGNGSGATATASVASSGCAVSHTCYPPAVNYTPFYFLINGQAFDKTNPARSLFAATAGTSTVTPITGTVLVRMVNAGLRMHVPSIVGSLTQGFTGAGVLTTATNPLGGFTLIAEDGNPLPDLAKSTDTSITAPRVKSEVFMAAGKTYDVLMNVPTASLPIFDRELSLSANSSVRDAGMLAYISVNGTSLPNVTAEAFGATSGVANPDSYASVAACGANAASCIPLVITDPSKGVVANDINVYGVELSTPPTSGTLTCNAVPGNPVAGICANGTFTYTPTAGTTAWAGDAFGYCANGVMAGTSGLCTTVTLSASKLSGTPVANGITYTSKIATFLKIPSPGVLSVDSDPNGLPLQVALSTVTQPSGVTINMDPQGGFTASVGSNTTTTACPNTAPTGASCYSFQYQAQNSQGSKSSLATVTLVFPLPSNLKVHVLDAQAYNSCNGDSTCIAKLTQSQFPDYRWIIEEDKTFYVDPNCTANSSVNTPGCPSVVGAAGQSTIPTSGVQFHTSTMDFVAQGCTGPLSCEGGQTMLDTNPSSSTFGQHVPAVCDLGNGACRPDPTGGQGSTPVFPDKVVLDPAKRYYISVLPGDAGNPFPTNASPAACNGQEATSVALDPTQSQCGHTMSGASIAPACNILGGPNACTSSSTFSPVNVLVLPTPLPTGKLSVLVFEDDYPLNGEQDGGGGNGGAIAPVEPGLGGFNIVLWDTYGGLGDPTGQNSNDMFNQPLSNSLAGTVDPTSGLDACPVSATPLVSTGAIQTTNSAGQVTSSTGGTITGNGGGPNPTVAMTGMIVTCPKYESDGHTLSPLAGQAVIANLMPEKFSVQAYPGADRIARGEEWIQTNTLDGQHPHDAFIEIGDPSYFQEYGPAGYHVMIGFANPAIINARHDDVCKGFGTPGSVGPCTNTIKGEVDVERLSRIPDERLYPSGSRDALAWTQCWVSLGDPDGEDFMFTKCDANGNFSFSNVPGGEWRLTIGDQWNDQIIDGLSTPANVGTSGSGAKEAVCPGTGSTQSLCNLGNIGVQQWQSNLYTRTYIDDNKDGIWEKNEIGIPLIYTMIHYRDGHNANALTTDFNGIAPFNETFPLFNWYVVEADSTRYKTTGIHTVYDAGGPADGSPSCGPGNGARACGGSTAYNNMSNTYESVPLPADLSVPGAVYCSTADCQTEAPSFAKGTAIASTGSASTSSTGRIDPPWIWAEGFAGLTGHSNWIDIGKAPYAGCNPALPVSGTNFCATVASSAPGATSATIMSITETGNTVTVTTSAANNLVTGSMATIAGVTPTGYDGTFQITTTSTTTFTYTDATSGLAAGTVSTSSSATAATTTQVGENGGVYGTVVYASTRPFDDASQMIQQPWEPNVPNVTVNLYQEGFAVDGVTPTLTMVDTTTTSSWDAWAQGFYPNSTAGNGNGTGQKPYMSCPGQDVAANDLFYFTLYDQPDYLDWYNSMHNGGTKHTLPYNSQFKCYDAMKINNQLQPAPYDGKYFFPSTIGRDATSGKLVSTVGTTNGVSASMAGTNCTICVANPDTTDPYRVGTPMLPPGKYVVEVIMPPGYEVYKEEDKNLLIGDNFVAPVTQQFGGLGGDVFILPDQASVASMYDQTGSGYNNTNYQNPTTASGLADELSGVPGFPGYTDPVWPCVGEMRVVPDYLSEFPQALETAPFAGATRPLCDRKEVTLINQMAVNARFFVFTSTHISSKYTGVITDDFTSEFDPFSPQFGEKFSPPNMPISTKDYLGNELSRVYSDHWGIYDGLTFSSWNVNPPNITGYSPAMMTQCMNDPGPVLDTRSQIPDPKNPANMITNPTFGQMITDPLYNPAYSDFCYINPYMPGLTSYLDTPVVPTEGFVGAGYNNPDCSYPDATPAVSEVDGDGKGPWVGGANGSGALSGVNLTLNYPTTGTPTGSGSGYSSAPAVHFSSGNATATATISGSVATVAVNPHGSGYSSTPALVSLVGGGGSGATATSIMDGYVASITVNAGGTGYVTAPTVTFTGGGGSNASATANLTGTVGSVTLTNNGGAGYSSAPTVTLSGGTGARATATMVRSVGSVSFTGAGGNRGSGYTSVPSVQFNGGGATTGAMGTAVIGVRSVNVTYGGTGYITPSFFNPNSASVTFSAPPGGGTRATGTPIVTNGVITGVTINNPGSGYTAVPTVTFNGTHTSTNRATGTAVMEITGVTITNAGVYPGTGVPTVAFSGGTPTIPAVGTAVMGQSVSSVTVTSPGTGYTNASTVTFSSPGGAGVRATGSINLVNIVQSVTVNNGGTGYTTAPTIGFTPTNGGTGAAATSSLLYRVGSVQVTAGGAGYSFPPQVQIASADGQGSGAAATASISGSVVSIALNNPGSGYLSAPTVSFSGGGGSGAAATASLSGGQLVITALGDQQVNNNAYSGPSANAAPFNAKTITRHYGFGAQCQAPTAGSTTCNTMSSVTIGVDSKGNPVPAAIVNWSDTAITVKVPAGISNCAIQQQAQYGGSTAQCGQLVITAGNGSQSIDTVTVTVGGKQPTHVTASQTIQSAIDWAAPGDLLIVDPTCTIGSATAACTTTGVTGSTPAAHVEAVLMWKPVRLQGVGAATSIIDANAFPSGKLLEPWRRHVNCLFGLTLNGVPLGGATAYDPSSTYTCPDSRWSYFGTDLKGVGGGSPNPNVPQVDRVPLEAVLGWDATLNGNLAEQLQEPSLMGAYEGAGITVVGKGVNTVGQPSFGTEGAFPTGSLLLQNVPAAADETGTEIPQSFDYCTTAANGARNPVELSPNPYPSNFECNPSSIDGLTIRDSSQGGGGIFVHGWNHNLQIANNRINNNAGTLSGGITLGQGEFPDPITVSGTTTIGLFQTVGEETSVGDVLPSCQDSTVVGTHLPYCLDNNVNMHNNAITSNSSLGDELFSGTLAGGGGATFCTGSDYYKFNYNWVCGNVSSAEGGGITHLGFNYHGDIEHNTIALNESSNPTVPTNGGGIMIMGTPDTDPVCTGIPDADCPPGLSDGTGPGLVVNANLIQANAADSGSGGGIRLQDVNGTEVSSFPSQPQNWNSVALTNNIIVNNVAGWDGAGISLQDALNVTIINNTISSNDSLATSGVLTQSIGTPVASSPTKNCTQTGPSGTTQASCPQPSGVSSTPNSGVLTTTFSGIQGGLKCPNGTTGCMSFSNPLLQNNVIWQNRSFYIGVGNPNPGLTNQQNQITLFQAFTSTTAPLQSSFGLCGSASYWDVGVRGDKQPGPNTGSGFALNPIYSVLDDPGYAASNMTSDPSIVSQYCNGGRVPPTCTQADGCGGPSGYGVPPGIVDASAPNPVFSLTAAATVDEGNNWVNVSWGPLALSDDSVTGGANSNYGGGPLFANYALKAGSGAIDYIPTSEPNFTLVPNIDFFGNKRPDTTGAKFDVGAIEFQGTLPAALSVSPTSLTFPSTSDGGTSAAQNLTLSNTGGSAATGISATVTAPFARSGGTCNGTLNAGATCTIGIVFSPTTQTGTVTGSATINASVGVTGSPVSLTGTGAAATASFSVSPSPLAFGNQARNVQSRPLAITVTNTGNVALAGGTFTFGGGTPQPFSHPAQTGACGATLAIGASCTYNVAFTPPSTSTNGTVFSRTLTVAYNGATGSGTPVTLTGTTETPAGTLSFSCAANSNCTIALGTVDFTVATANAIVTLTNTGTGQLQIYGESITAGVGSATTIASTTCTTTALAPAGSCTVTLAPHGFDIFGALNVTNNGTTAAGGNSAIGLFVP